MNEEIASIVTQRVQLQIGALFMENVRLQAEKEALEKALAAKTQEPAE